MTPQKMFFFFVKGPGAHAFPTRNDTMNGLASYQRSAARSGGIVSVSLSLGEPPASVFVRATRYGPASYEGDDEYVRGTLSSRLSSKRKYL